MNEQKLIDLCFSMILSSTSNKKFCKKSNEEKAKWISDTLKENGFNTTPVGSSWGILKNKL